MDKHELNEIYSGFDAEQMEAFNRVVNQLVSYGFSVEEASEMVLIRIKEVRDKKNI